MPHNMIEQAEQSRFMFLEYLSEYLQEYPAMSTTVDVHHGGLLW